MNGDLILEYGSVERPGDGGPRRWCGAGGALAILFFLDVLGLLVDQGRIPEYIRGIMDTGPLSGSARVVAALLLRWCCCGRKRFGGRWRPGVRRVDGDCGHIGWRGEQF